MKVREKGYIKNSRPRAGRLRGKWWSIPRNLRKGALSPRHYTVCSVEGATLCLSIFTEARDGNSKKEETDNNQVDRYIVHAVTVGGV